MAHGARRWMDPVMVVLLTVELDGDRRRACGKGWPKRQDWTSPLRQWSRSAQQVCLAVARGLLEECSLVVTKGGSR
ncbi:hypothetical protein NL676_021063 [Syzygium grande]|nr:hypothetical protein NL676_021063 [Syzygium grande]